MDAFDFNLLWVAKSNFPPRHLIKTHSHDYFQMILVLAGEGEITINSVVNQAQVNQLYIIHPDEKHKITSSENKPLHLSELKFRCNNTFTGETISTLTPFIENASSGLYQLFLMILEEIENQNAYFSEVINLVFTQIIYFLLRNTRGDDYHSLDFSGQVKYNEKVVNIQPVRDVIEYINNNYQKDLTLNELAKIACFSRVYFCALFKETCGISPMHYLLRKRLENSQRLLYTEQSISVIASQVGFSSVHYFSKIFKEKFGISPSKFRERNQKNVIVDFAGNITDYS